MGKQIVNLERLLLLGNRTKSEIDSVNKKIQDITSVGGEPNTIETIKVNGVVQTPDSNRAVNITVPDSPEYSITKDTSSSQYAAVYHLTKGGVNTGTEITIPKDMVVQSGSVETKTTSGEWGAAGTYLHLVLANATEDDIYINVGDLIEYVTSGSAAGDMVVISVDATTHKVTATITDGTITGAKLADKTVTGAKIADGTITSGKLASDIQTALTKLSNIAANATKVEKSTTNGNIKIDGTETTVYTLPDTVLQDADIATEEEVNSALEAIFNPAT